MILKRALGVAIVLFWCFMNVLLVKRQLASAPPPVTLATVSVVTESLEEWWGVYFRAEKIGYASQKLVPQKDGYRLQSESVLRLNLLGTTQDVRTRLEMSANADWTMRQFDFELNSTNVRFSARGEFAGNKLSVETSSGGAATKTELTMRQPPYLLAALKPYVVTQQLEPGKPNIFPTFDPATLSQQFTTVVVEGRERVRIGDNVEPAIRVRQEFRGLSVTSWLDGNGRTLKEESPTGLSLVKEKAEDAVVIPGAKSIALDLVAQTAVPVEEPIAEPQRKERLKLRLSGFNLNHFPLNGQRQRLAGDTLEIRREDLSAIGSYKLPATGARYAAYLQPSPFVQSDHPRIRALARKILKKERDAMKAAVKLKDWVYRELAKEPTVSIPNALEVLQTKRGDCNEHTVLFTALARAAGIPAKTVVGVVYLRGSFYYHAWSEVWVGEWVSLDSVLNQFPADVTHVKFLEGEIDRQIDMLQLIGSLKIKVVEAS